MTVSFTGPIVYLPPDDKIGEEVSILSDEIWSIPKELSDLVGPDSGLGTKVAVLDTGMTSHELLPEPLDARSFIAGENWRDGNGHGCIAPTDEIYTSNCGLQTIETFYERMSGIVHYLQDGSIIKDITRFNINTFSLSLREDIPKPVKRRITHVHKLPYDGIVHKVCVNGETLTLTPWHPVYVEVSSTGTKRRVTKKRADELKVGDKICLMPKSEQSISNEYLQIPKLNDVMMKLDEDLAMWLGLVITDGHLTKSQATVEFSTVNPKHQELFVNLTKKIFDIDCGVYESRTAKSIRCSGIPWYIAKKFMPVGKKSKTLEFPELIAKSPRSVIESFIAGCIEGDGCTSGDKVRLTTGSEKFAIQLCKLLSCLGIKNSRSYQTGENSNFGGDGWWVVCIGSWPEMEARLQVKCARKIKPKGNYHSVVKEITTEHYKGNLYDLTVDKSHNYLANGLVVSNTHCAGTILGRRKSGFPNIGVAPAASLLVGKVLSNGGSGSSQAITDGILWAINQGADVISMSLGSSSPYAPMQKALQAAWEAGCIVVSAAGNSGFTGAHNTIGFPAKFPESLCIGAYQRNGQRASFSSGGRELDILCPGQDIISCSIRNSLVSMSGTSMATPWAAGFFAYLISRMRRQGRAAFTGIEAVRQFLAVNCLDQGTPGKDDFTGWGVPNAPLMTKAISLNLKWLAE